MEIVSYPDLSDWEEAGDYVSKLRNILDSRILVMGICKKDLCVVMLMYLYES